MLRQRPVLHHHNIHVLNDRLEKRGGDAGTMELKGMDVFQMSKRVEANERGDILVLDFRKTHGQTIF
jgi:hypothetical protein